ncbi:MAG: hypothetical protein JWR04_1796 [Rhodoglobus sp.]|nr:hypothetical protein [Rhodoglobus sp.]
MGQLAALRTAQVAVASTVAGSSAESLVKAKERADATQKTSLGTIVAYIPSEAVSFYIAGLALVAAFPAEGKTAGLWVVVAISVIANFAFTLLAFKQTIQGTVAGALGSGRFWAAIGIATVALAVYAVALPDNPFLGVAYYFSPLILLAGVLLVPLAANFAGLTPKTEPTPAPAPTPTPAPVPAPED